MNRLELTPGIRRRMQYRKLAGDVPRMLVLRSDYWLDDACMAAAGELGWDVRHVPVPAKGLWPREQIGTFLTALLEFRPDFVLTINLSGMDAAGLFARFFEDLQLPLVTWFIDDPRTILMGRKAYGTPCAAAFTWERSYIDYLRREGFGLVEWLPLAVDTQRFSGEPVAGEGRPCFVGNSMAAPAAEEWAWMSAHPELAQAVREAIENGAVDRRRFAVGLDAVLPQPVVATLDEDQRRHAELLLFVEGTRRLRAGWAKALTREGMIVYGDAGWRDVLPDACPPVGYFDELAALYRSSAVNLNITSIQMATGVNQRVFDCPAAGGFLLTDAQDDLRELFAADEVACYRNTEECVELLNYYRARPQLRLEITRRAMQRILNEHTYVHRLKAIATSLCNNLPAL